MISQVKKICYINLDKKICDIKSVDDYGKYIGGVGLGAKILLDLKDNKFFEPVVFSVGPLTGYFPFVSKTSVMFKHRGGVKDLYFGGSLSSRIKFTGIDAIVIYGSLEEKYDINVTDEKVVFNGINENIKAFGLPGKRARLKLIEDNGNKKVILDNYFKLPGYGLGEKFFKKNINSITITGTKVFEIENKQRFVEVYKSILNKLDEITTEKSGNPSCFGCPMGCSSSKIGEEGGDFLSHSLVACNFASKIYSEVSTVFSCLDALGYAYVHEDLEKFPNVVYDLLKRLNNE